MTRLRWLGRGLGEQGCELRAGPRQAWAGLKKGAGSSRTPGAGGWGSEVLIDMGTNERGTAEYLGEMGGAWSEGAEQCGLRARNLGPIWPRSVARPGRGLKGGRGEGGAQTRRDLKLAGRRP